MLPSLLTALFLAVSPASAQSFGPAFEALRAQGAAVGAAAPAVAAPPSRAMTPDQNETASDVFGQMISGMPASLRSQMRDRVFVTVVPRDQRLVDAIAAELRRRLPAQAAEVKIRETLQSYASRIDIDPKAVRRTPAEPRGYTGLFYGKVYTFVGAENLTATGAWDENGSRARRILYHELGHATLDVVLTKEMYDFLEELTHGGDGSELWAESTERWFGVYQSRIGVSSASDKDLSSLDPRLKNLLNVIYGPSRVAGQK